MIKRQDRALQFAMRVNVHHRRGAWAPLLGLLLALGAIPPPDGARAATDAAEDPDALRDLLALIDEQTALATREGMNADFVPGMATILAGDELLPRGARTVWEALALVPGITQGLEMTGERQVLSRGVGHGGYTSGNIKILLNGMSMNSAVTATANAVLNLPIEQIERIEVIRGPGASVHGEYAFAGVVNVITRRGERTLHAQAADGQRHGLGGVWSWTDPQRDLRVSVNAAGLEGQAGVPVAGDALQTIGRASLSNAPGHSNEAARHGSLFLNLDWGKTFALVQLLDDRYGDHFGAHHFLPPDDNRLAIEQRFLATRIGHDLTLSNRLRATLRLDAWRHERFSDLYLFPAGMMGPNPVYMEQEYAEERYQLATDLHWRPHDRHRVLFGLEATRATLVEPVPNWTYTSRDRRILGVLAQDQIHVTDRIDLTATLRLDDYDDLYSDRETFVSPRLAGVWRVDDQNILKLQYARAFRPPTFFDLEYPYPAGDPVEASVIATYELGYILKQPRWEARWILYHSDLERPVTLAYGGRGFENSSDVRLRGIEFEYELRITPDLKLDAAAAWSEAWRLDTGRDLEGGTGVLANLALLWRPVPGWTTTLQLRHVGERARADYDPKEPLAGYTTLDLGLQYRPSPRGLHVTIGAKNLADAEVRYPYLSFVGPRRLPPEDYLRPGRSWWLSVGYAF